MEMKTPLDLWPGMEPRHAANLWLMNWQPSTERTHALLRSQDVNNEDVYCSFGATPEALRECAAALNAAAEWLEKNDHRRQQHPVS